jgi:hypothetical protein
MHPYAVEKLADHRMQEPSADADRARLLSALRARRRARRPAAPRRPAAQRRSVAGPCGA